MKNDFISKERKQYIRKNKKRKILVLLTQIAILIGLLAIWEIAANNGAIDSFITSKPSKIYETFLNLISGDLLKHVWVTTYETIVGFVLGTILGILIAIILWWSEFLSKVSEPYLVVLNSLPKVALRTNYNNMGWSRNRCNNNNGNINISNSNNIRKFKWFFTNRQRNNKNGKSI